eukprot:754898-Hanusia_phi.AAC.5
MRAREERPKALRDLGKVFGNDSVPEEGTVGRVAVEAENACAILLIFLHLRACDFGPTNHTHFDTHHHVYRIRWRRRLMPRLDATLRLFANDGKEVAGLMMQTIEDFALPD